MAYLLKIVSLALLIDSVAYSTDFGIHGHTFPIEEQDLIEYLQEKLSICSEEEKVQIENKLQESVIHAFEQPIPCTLPEANQYYCHFHDPTVIVQEEIVDIDGQIIIEKGTHYNPLEVFAIQPMLFFDGDNPKHVKWAKEEEGKWVLTSGNPINLGEEEGMIVYFDQFGYLSKKLGICAIPARVSQEGQLLKIEEIPLENK